jgi:FkbM family methyltransferase
MKSKNIVSLYQHIMHFLPPLTYLDVGARAIKGNRLVGAFPQARYIGFELDVEECNRLNSLNIERHQFHPQAIGRRDDSRTLYVTRNPACSSLYEPNVQEMHRFMDCGPYFDVLEKTTVETVSLDDWCRDAGISGVEFLELDTQGSELDILQGSEHLLAASILGLQVEVEFFPIYKDQPLFSDVDNYLRQRGFRLFDLSRYRLRRAYLKTRGQLLWGHAFYLKDVHQLNKDQLTQYLALAAIASYLRFEDYAVEVLEILIKKKSHLEPYDHIAKIQGILASYSDRFSRPTQRGIKRLWKKASMWKVASKKDGGYFIKD